MTLASIKYWQIDNKNIYPLIISVFAWHSSTTGGITLSHLWEYFIEISLPPPLLD